MTTATPVQLLAPGRIDTGLSQARSAKTNKTTDRFIHSVYYTPIQHEPYLKSSSLHFRTIHVTQVIQTLSIRIENLNLKFKSPK